LFGKRRGEEEDFMDDLYNQYGWMEARTIG
jgi:hypothetical protein